MAWKTKHLKLTKDQLERGVIFSSALIMSGEKEQDVIHEVIPELDKDWRETWDRLTNVTFFKQMARDFHFDVVEIRRS